MIDDYYKKEIEKLNSIPLHLSRIEKSTIKICNSIDFLIKKKNLDNAKTKKIKLKADELLAQIKKFISDPYLGECPYNDPTLNREDPYYMKPPFGNTPEQLKKLSQNYNKNEKHD